MAGNFWQSSHYRQWLLDKQDLLKERAQSSTLLDDDEYKKIMIFYINFIQALGEQLKLRQQVIATATVYFKRFYCRNPLKSIDPLLVAPTTIFLATKVEEFGVISNTRFINTTQQLIKAKYFHVFPEFAYKIQSILECEFYLMEAMDCCLIVYHPYRCMLQYVADICPEDTTMLPLIWRLLNDTLRTDVCLLYPPYLIALSCIHIACILQKKNARNWFSEITCDIDKMIEITREVFTLYEFWKGYDEKNEIKGLLHKMAKPNKLPSRPSSSQGNGSSQQFN